jgi:hypothetical protein
LKKHLKYLISLFLVFGLMVIDCDLYSQSNSAAYYQFSNVILRKESNNKVAKLYVFNQAHSSGKTSFPILLAYLQFQDSYSLQIQILFKIRTLLYQEVRSITAQYIFINEMIISRNAFISLYIA